MFFFFFFFSKMITFSRTNPCSRLISTFLRGKYLLWFFNEINRSRIFRNYQRLDKNLLKHDEREGKKGPRGLSKKMLLKMHTSAKLILFFSHRLGHATDAFVEREGCASKESTPVFCSTSKRATR